MTLTLILLLCAFVTYHSFNDWLTARDVAHTKDVARANSQAVADNHALICRLDLLFGLDRKPPTAELRKLRPSQIRALDQIVAACPNLKPH